MVTTTTSARGLGRYAMNDVRWSLAAGPAGFVAIVGSTYVTRWPGGKVDRTAGFRSVAVGALVASRRLGAEQQEQP